MRLHILRTKKYEKNFKKYFKSNLVDLNKLNFVINKIADREPLLQKFRDHKLVGDLKNCRECHIQSDVLLLYQIQKEELVLILIDIGSHSDLFS